VICVSPAYPLGDKTVFQFAAGNYAGTDALRGTRIGEAPAVGVAESFFVLNREPTQNWPLQLHD